MSTSVLDRFGPLDWQQLTIEPAGSEDGACDCCGTTTRRAWGFVACDDQGLAGYVVGWTLGKPDHGAVFDLILGRWGDDTGAADRCTVSLDYRVVDGAAAFMVVTRPESAAAQSALVETALAREQVIGTPLAQAVFAVADAVLMKDARVGELRIWT